MTSEINEHLNTMLKQKQHLEEIFAVVMEIYNEAELTREYVYDFRHDTRYKLLKRDIKDFNAITKKQIKSIRHTLEELLKITQRCECYICTKKEITAKVRKISTLICEKPHSLMFAYNINKILGRWWQIRDDAYAISCCIATEYQQLRKKFKRVRRKYKSNIAVPWELKSEY